MTATTKAHLHAVLKFIDEHIDDAGAALATISIRGGHVSIETSPADLAKLALSLGLGAPALQPALLASGADFAIVPCAVTGVFDGAPLRLWAATVIPVADYAALRTGTPPAAPAPALTSPGG